MSRQAVTRDIDNRYWASVKEVGQLYRNQIVVDEEDYGIVIAELSCMKTPCKSILQHYYLDNLNLKEIALSLGYKSAQSVKVQKYRCLKTLKDNIFKIKVK
jgi:DNA-directed RNA polymerase specialized sigma subunit